MKIITEQYFNSIVEGIIKEKEKQADQAKQPFIGLSSDELWGEIGRQLEVQPGEKWMVKRQPMKFTKQDINAVASGRFYRKTGVQLLMALVIILLAMSVAVRYIPDITSLGYNIYYTLCGLVGLGFIYIYSRKQAKVRKELWRQLGREETKEGK